MSKYEVAIILINEKRVIDFVDYRDVVTIVNTYFYNLDEAEEAGKNHPKVLDGTCIYEVWEL